MQPNAELAPGGGARCLIKLLLVAAAVLLLLLPVELGIRLAARRSEIIRQEVEIQDPATLFAKISALSRSNGRRVALIGDSLVYGAAMRDAGVPEWRSQNLAGQLRERFTHHQPAGKFHVMNLGMNGALPADIERIVDALLVSGVDTVVMDVTLRSLSRDFVSADMVYSRKWLPSFAMTAEAGLAPIEAAGLPAFDDTIRNWAINHSYAYRLRDLFRLYFLGREPDELVRQFRDRVGAWARPADGVDAETRLLLLARARYASVSLDPSNPQVVALSNLLDKLNLARMRTLVFYATERPDLIEAVTDPELHRERLARLSDIIRARSGPRMTYLGPLATLLPGDFIDYVHVFPSGYGKYADAIIDRLDAIPDQ